jgi:hypothetical protein
MSSLRKAAILVGMAILLFAGWSLGRAILHAVETGTVLLGETTPTTASSPLRGMKWPYPVFDAWAYFVGWIAIGSGGILLITASSKTLGRVLLVPVLCLLGFMLIAAAPMLGSFRGVVFFLTVFLGASVVAAVIALWLSGRADRELHDESD